MRTTIRLNEKVLREAKAYAARAGQSLTRVIEDALREKLNGSVVPKRKKTGLPVFAGKGLQPGVSLEHNAALLELMDEDTPVSSRR